MDNLRPRWMLTVLLVVMFLAGCAGTDLVNSWHEAQYSGPPLHKVMVVGMLEKDISRRFFETQFVDALQSRGREGVQSFHYIENLQDFDNKEKLVAAVQKSGVDAVLLVSLQGVQEEDHHTQGYFTWQPSFYHGYAGYYHHAYTARYVPGHNLVQRKVRLESRVYAVQGGKLIWAGYTESFNPSSAQKAIDQLAEIIIDDMQEYGFID